MLGFGVYLFVKHRYATGPCNSRSNVHEGRDPSGPRFVYYVLRTAYSVLCG
jgi:hypothetical protein